MTVRAQVGAVAEDAEAVADHSSASWRHFTPCGLDPGKFAESMRCSARFAAEVLRVMKGDVCCLRSPGMLTVWACLRPCHGEGASPTRILGSTQGYTMFVTRILRLRILGLGAASSMFSHQTLQPDLAYLAFTCASMPPCIVRECISHILKIVVKHAENHGRPLVW